MYAQLSIDVLILLMLYAGAATMALIASLYLLLRRGNAFAPGVVPSVRLRRWTAALLGCMALSHVWYMPAAILTSEHDIIICMLIGGLLDSLTVLPLAFIVMICMLQDRRRPLWPVAVMMIPFVVLIVANMVDSSNAYITMIRIYYILFAVGMAIYMVRAVRQYGRWLRDNYADLENKEVWQSIVVLAAILLTFTIYISGGGGGMAYEYIVQLCGIVLTYYLLWRVETLSDLSAQAEKPIQTASQTDEQLAVTPSDAPTDTATDTLSDTHSDIEELLQKFCVDTQLYLEHDLSVSQLAQTIGTNRTYLSQYFSSQQTTYNSYINTLRINHFVNIYREAVAAGQPFTVQLLSARSGYHSYSTFSLAFKQRMGQSVSAWIRQQAESAADV